jgi:16S rRNA (guanine527-N7)-methyltransferase
MARAKSSTPDLGDDRARALALTPVSRETSQRLDRFVALLLQWQRTTNLIARSTIPTLWTRHIADSLQLFDLAPQARVWSDFGAGAGFPGLVLACRLADRPESQSRIQARVHLVERNAKKAAFLREARRVTGAPAVVHAGSMAEVLPTLPSGIEVVTARAVAPLKELLDQCHPLLGRNGATALFPKGQHAELELAEAARFWDMEASLVASRTDPKGRIVVIRGVVRRGKSL